MDNSTAFARQLDAPQPASVEGQVMIAVQQQEKLLSMLGQTVEMLENRLGNGLRPSPPAAVGRGDDRQPTPSRSSLADMLQSSNARIAEAQSRLTDITSRVDL